MATRSIIRFAKREAGVTFNEHPETWDAQFYAHWDGYPEHRGIEIAESVLHGNKIEGWEIDYLDTSLLVIISANSFNCLSVILSFIVRIVFVFVN